MYRRHGGQKVKRGYYFDWKKKSFAHITRDGDILPGSSEYLYLGFNVFEVIVYALIVSGLYVLFLPLIGFLTLAFFASIAIVVFIFQKILCKLISRICEAEHWMCKWIGLICKQCGRDCDENQVAMGVKAFIFSFFWFCGYCHGHFF